MAPLGFWHLNINDLLAVSLYVGAMLAIMKALTPDHFLSAGVPFAVICGVAFVIGLLVAARAGIRNGRFFYAMSCGLRLTGLFSLGAVCAIMIMDKLTYDAPFYWIRTVLFGDVFSIYRQAVWAVLLHRMALYSLPVGLVCFEVAKRRAKREMAASIASKTLASEPAHFESISQPTPATIRI